jgi:hypothetical protein
MRHHYHPMQKYHNLARLAYQNQKVAHVNLDHMDVSFLMEYPKN